jgi:hypothetical protein
MTLLIIVACSALLGRLLLTRDQAWQTITVRLPALAMLLLCIVVCGAAAIIFAVVCFIGGSFYGLATWWLPSIGGLVDGAAYPIGAIVHGRWPTA